MNQRRAESRKPSGCMARRWRSPGSARPAPFVRQICPALATAVQALVFQAWLYRSVMLVLELTGKKTPHEGLEGKFSIYHAVAVAIVEGAAGEKPFSERAVRDPIVVGLRSKVMPVVDPSIKPEQVDLTIVLKDGRKLHKYIEHAIGSLEVPMTDSALETKFSDLAEGILPGPQIRRLMDACWGVEKLPSAAAIAQAAVV